MHGVIVGVGLAPAHLFHERAAARATPTKPLLNSLYSTALQLTCRTRSSTVFALEARSHNPWKARLTIGLIMLGMALISLIILQMHAAIYWFFCWAMAIIDAILCIGWECMTASSATSWNTRTKKRSIS